MNYPRDKCNIRYKRKNVTGEHASFSSVGGGKTFACALNSLKRMDEIEMFAKCL